MWNTAAEGTFSCSLLIRSFFDDVLFGSCGSEVIWTKQGSYWGELIVHFYDVSGINNSGTQRFVKEVLGADGFWNHYDEELGG